MPEFVRSFDVDRLAEWDARHPGNAVRALFARWAVPGHVGTPEASLRLGLRKNYVNFYVSGQSVAKLFCGQRDLKVSVHEAYATGRARRSGDPPERPPTKNYVDYDGEALARAETADSIARWVTTAETYANAEKRFVDRLVEANPGVIDLEMGLPATWRRGRQ